MNIDITLTIYCRDTDLYMWLVTCALQLSDKLTDYINFDTSHE